MIPCILAFTIDLGSNVKGLYQYLHLIEKPTRRCVGESLWLDKRNGQFDEKNTILQGDTSHMQFRIGSVIVNPAGGDINI
jgi:hypothetical protein